MKSINAKLLKDMFISGNNNLQNHKDLVDKLNVFPVPDGDTGTNMSLTMLSSVKDLNNTNYDISEISKSITRGSLMGARGNSGVILSQILRGFCKSIEGKESLNTADLALALKEGYNTAYKAVIKPVEGTILTVIRETADAAEKIALREDSVIKFFEEIIKASTTSLNKTPELLKSLKEAGVVDSGGKGLVIIFEGMLRALKNEMVEIQQQSEKTYEEITVDTMPLRLEDITFAYCTEFIVKTNKISDIEIRNLMMPLGDSLAVVSYDDIIKVHIHTNEPNKALEIALKYGRLETIKIENMIVQFEQAQKDKKETEKPKKFGIIATTAGEGLANIFKELGVDYIIEGGQTSNPSTEDFLKAISSVNAENIIILPNNSNIIMAANQAKELSDKNVIVIPTKTIPQGISCMMNFNCETPLEDIEEVLVKALSLVKTGQITYAVKDTCIDGVEVKEGDYIGLAEKTLCISTRSIEDALLTTVENLFDEDAAIITLYYGEDVSEDNVEAVLELLQGKYQDIDVEAYEGGQPLYPYLIAVE